MLHARDCAGWNDDDDQRKRDKTPTAIENTTDSFHAALFSNSDETVKVAASSEIFLAIKKLRESAARLGLHERDVGTVD